jgi:hypothetical protein
MSPRDYGESILTRLHTSSTILFPGTKYRWASLPAILIQDKGLIVIILQGAMERIKISFPYRESNVILLASCYSEQSLPQAWHR